MNGNFETCILDFKQQGKKPVRVCSDYSRPRKQPADVVHSVLVTVKRQM